MFVQTAPLVVIEPESPRAELCVQNPILLVQIVDDFLLLVIHPTGNTDQQQPKGIQGLWHPQSLAPISSRSGMLRKLYFQTDQVSGH